MTCINKWFYYLVGKEWHKPKKCRMSAMSAFLQDHWITRSVFWPRDSQWKSSGCMFCPSCVWGLWLLCSSHSQAVGLGRYLCASATEQPRRTLKFALPQARACTRGPPEVLSKLYFSMRGDCDLTQQPLFPVLPYVKQGTWQKGCDPLLLPYLSTCQECAFHFGENRTPICSAHLRRIPSRRSIMHNVHCW